MCELNTPDTTGTADVAMSHAHSCISCKQQFDTAALLMEHYRHHITSSDDRTGLLALKVLHYDYCAAMPFSQFLLFTKQLASDTERAFSQKSLWNMLHTNAIYAGHPLRVIRSMNADENGRIIQATWTTPSMLSDIVASKKGV